MIKKIIIWISVIFIVFSGIVFSVLVYQGYKRYEEATSIFTVEEVGNQVINSDYYVSYENIDEDFVNALVAIEDNRFFKRKGIDFIAIGRAVVFNLIKGKVSQGGSTITQQLAKNLYFTHAKSLTRKIAEVFFVDDFEKNFTHEEIFAMYANVIYYGDNNYGILDASKNYFGKSPDDLSLYEASLLAGLPQSPSKYQLSNGYEEAHKRQKKVLSAMLKYGYITEKEYNDTLSLQNE